MVKDKKQSGLIYENERASDAAALSATLFNLYMVEDMIGREKLIRTKFR